MPHPDEQFDETRPREGEERNARLAGHRPGHEGFAGSRWSDHQHPSRPNGARAGVALGIAQEVDDLGNLPLGTFIPSDVGKAGRGFLLVVDLGPRSPEAHDSPGQLLGAPPSNPDEKGDKQQQREKGEQIGQECGPLSHTGDVDAVGLQGRGQLRVVDGRRDLARVVVASLERAGDGAAGIDRRCAYVARGDLGQELRIAEVLGRRAGHVRNKKQEQRDEDPDRQEPHAPPWGWRACRCRGPIVGLTWLGCSREVADRVRHVDSLSLRSNLDEGDAA